MMSLLQDVISWRSYLLVVCVLLTVTSLILAGHHLEDEVRHYAMFGLILNDFSVRENDDEFFYPKMVHLEY
jgi:glucose-6-phosphate-specific signal transduction histidine kinase